MVAGYSNTPLARKIGLREGSHLLTVDAPAELDDWLEPLPEGLTFDSALSHATDVVHVFVTEQAALDERLRSLRHAIRPDAMVWISWPKKNSKVPTDITEDRIRDIALPLGFVDVKVCAVSEVWSGLKLVIRKELRG